MKSLTIRALAFAAFTLTLAAAAQAQATRTWVSGVGDDVNPCSRTAPCKTFAGAISKTATGGEIDALDPGGFGTLTITKALTVDGTNGQGFGSILASGLSGITVNITTGAASDKVILRNLSINGNNAVGGFHGIRFLAGAELVVENVDIFNFTGSGISISQGQTSATTIHNVRIDNCASGITVSTTTGEALVNVRNAMITKFTGNGVLATNNVRLGIVDSTVSSGPTGVATNGSNSIINADDIFVSHCTTGLSGGVGSPINISDSIIAQNATGISGTVNSFQGNSLINNPTPGSFSSTTLKQ